MELWARHRDGWTFPVDVSISPAAFAGGTVVLAAVRDISARRHAERVARQWAELFERAAWGVVISNPDGTRLERMNPAFARMHGWTVEELVGRPLLDVSAPEAHVALAAHLDEVNRSGHHRFESVHIRKDGSTFPVEVDATLIRDDDGGVRYRAAHVMDITDRKRIEEAARQSESRFRRVFTAAPFGIAVLDSELHITDANDALSTMLGLDAARLIGRTFGELTPSEDARRFEGLGAHDQACSRHRRHQGHPGERRDLRRDRGGVDTRGQGDRGERRRANQQLSRSFIRPDERPSVGPPEPEIEEFEVPRIPADVARRMQEKSAFADDDDRDVTFSREAQAVHDFIHSLSKSGGKAELGGAGQVQKATAKKAGGAKKATAKKATAKKAGGAKKATKRRPPAR